MSKDKVILPKGTLVPNHIAIIPDGNRRWARYRGLHTLKGHQKGFETAVEVCRVARSWGVHTVTLWGFSTENWDRSEAEINYLMRLYGRMIDKFIEEAKENKVRIYHLGRKDRIPKVLLRKIEEAEAITKKYNKYIMNIAIDYGGHDDIIRAVRAMVKDGVAPENIDKKMFENYLDTKGQPYPYVDLMIRTSGEQRTSGLLLWQTEYAEYYWEKDHFPDFNSEKLKQAILDYSRRRRRFGGNDAEDHLKFEPEVVAKFEIDWWRLGKIPEGMKFREYAMNHLKEQFGLSKKLSTEASKLLLEALVEENKSKWIKAGSKLKKFYELVRDEVKLAFEPKIVASLEVKIRRENGENELTTREYLAEVYRISLFQAAKAAHLRVLANVEKNLALAGMGEHHWVKAQDYLEKYYHALKERVA